MLANDVLKFGRKLPEDMLLIVNGRHFPVKFLRHPRARRYVLRLRGDGSARVTIPRGGTIAEAVRFAERNQDWLARQSERLAARPSRIREWRLGSEIFWRGHPTRLEPDTIESHRFIRLADERIRVSDPTSDLRPDVERHLWNLAARELPPRVQACATSHRFMVRRVTVRNQKTRWGSCSRHGTISLNWRLIQTPSHVCDYIILHELCHLSEMNHSSRFWREVERVCPDYSVAERWLKQNAALLR